MSGWGRRVQAAGRFLRTFAIVHTAFARVPSFAPKLVVLALRPAGFAPILVVVVVARQVALVIHATALLASVPAMIPVEHARPTAVKEPVIPVTLSATRRRVPAPAIRPHARRVRLSAGHVILSAGHVALSAGHVLHAPTRLALIRAPAEEG